MKLTRRAFTLVEMLIVIVIIGILAAALLPQLTGMQSRARDSARLSAVRNLSAVMQTYVLDNNNLPGALSGANGQSVGSSTLESALVNDSYLTSMPVDPNNRGFTSTPAISSDACPTDSGADYLIADSGNGFAYIVTARLENKSGNSADCKVGAPEEGSGQSFFKAYSN